jgi:hypothetical protein
MRERGNVSERIPFSSGVLIRVKTEALISYWRRIIGCLASQAPTWNLCLDFPAH